MSHPKGPRARVLLSSVFGPFACDDEYGSRAINPAELYHNQVTREQGPFSLRMFHRSWGISLIQHNIPAPSTVLDFPTRDSFVAELQAGDYDIVGISSIIVNVGKVREMCRLTRQYSPHSRVIVGGHVAAIPGLESMIDADEIVKGEGIRWFREYLGVAPKAPIAHPAMKSSFDFRVMGLPASNGAGNPAATIIPSVGCPLGCNFCSTSAMFGGKGRFYSFYEDGDQLFEVMSGIEQGLGVRSFFVMDENFLLHRKRALRLLERMQEHGRAWALYVFSSANALRLYSDEQLVQLGISWVWLGLEGEHSAYKKLDGTDTRALVMRLQALGIRVHAVISESAPREHLVRRPAVRIIPLPNVVSPRCSDRFSGRSGEPGGLLEFRPSVCGHPPGAFPVGCTVFIQQFRPERIQAGGANVG